MYRRERERERDRGEERLLSVRCTVLLPFPLLSSADVVGGNPGPSWFCGEAYFLERRDIGKGNGGSVSMTRVELMWMYIVLCECPTGRISQVTVIYSRRFMVGDPST